MSENVVQPGIEVEPNHYKVNFRLRCQRGWFSGRVVKASD